MAETHWTITRSLIASTGKDDDKFTSMEAFVDLVFLIYDRSDKKSARNVASFQSYFDVSRQAIALD